MDFFIWLKPATFMYQQQNRMAQGGGMILGWGLMKAVLSSTAWWQSHLNQNVANRLPGVDTGKQRTLLIKKWIVLIFKTYLHCS